MAQVLAQHLRKADNVGSTTVTVDGLRTVDRAVSEMCSPVIPSQREVYALVYRFLVRVSSGCSSCHWLRPSDRGLSWALTAGKNTTRY